LLIIILSLRHLSTWGKRGTISAMNETFCLPLLPLHTVLFPEQPLLLHVFEARHRRLVEHCLEEYSEFGAVLIRQELEGDGPALPHPVGTTARIIHHWWVEEDQVQLVVLGRRRFRLSDVMGDGPYVEAEVSLWPWSPEPAPVPGLMEEIGGWLRRYVAALTNAAPAVLAPEALPRDAVTLGVLAALVLQVSLAEKQALLETPTAADLLARACALLRRQTHITEQIDVFQPTGPQAFERISWN